MATDETEANVLRQFPPSTVAKLCGGEERFPITKSHEILDYRTFSQRHGLEALPTPMRVEELSADLRTEIWNDIRILLFGLRDRGIHGYFFGEKAARFIERVVGKLTKKPHDSISTRYSFVLEQFKGIILTGKFNVVLDLVEIIANDRSIGANFAGEMSHRFRQHGAAYSLDTSRKPYFFTPRASPEEAMATEQAITALHAANMEGATTHLRNAAKHISRQDWGAAIADSIHAVESVARSIDPKASRSLGAALDSLERAGLLKHPALKQAFSKLYGYTSDEQGIRHALLDQGSPEVGLDEALFMFGACASFAAYLVTKKRRQA